MAAGLMRPSCCEDEDDALPTLSTRGRFSALVEEISRFTAVSLAERVYPVVGPTR